MNGRRITVPSGTDSRRGVGRLNLRRRAFTLPEVMIAMSVFLLVTAAIVAANLFGVRMLQTIQPKIEADEQARRILSGWAGELGLVDEVRSARGVQVGTGSESSFVKPADNAARVGNALQLTNAVDQMATPPIWSTRYYWDSGSRQLLRMENGDTPVAVLGGITNSDVFRAQEFNAGFSDTTSCLNQDRDRPVILIKLDFAAVGQSAVPVGSGLLFTNYQLQVRVTPR